MNNFEITLLKIITKSEYNRLYNITVFEFCFLTIIKIIHNAVKYF